MSEEIKYKFENLQPINFLKRFNKMVQEDSKVPLKTLKKQLKVFPLSRFPEPQFYQNMQGIFETGIKKKDITSTHQKNKDDVQDQQFIDKHRAFMTKHIQKILLENEAHQLNLQNQKKHFDKKDYTQQDHKKIGLQMLRMRSQPKFRKQKFSKNFTKNDDHLDPIDNKQSQIDKNHDNAQEDDSLTKSPKGTYLQKISKERLQGFRNPKKAKIKLKNQKQTKEFLDTRKSLLSERKKQPSLFPSKTIEYNNISAQDQKKAFIQNLLSLQKQQNNFQRKFDLKIQSEISRFNSTIQSSISKIKVQKFW